MAYNGAWLPNMLMRVGMGCRVRPQLQTLLPSSAGTQRSVSTAMLKQPCWSISHTSGLHLRPLTYSIHHLYLRNELHSMQCTHLRMARSRVWKEHRSTFMVMVIQLKGCKHGTQGAGNQTEQ